MADNITTDVATLASKDVGGVQYPRNLITDETGADAVGVVGSSPAANTLLGRLKTIADGITTLSSSVDGLEALATALNGFVDGVEGLIGTTNTTLTTMSGYVDGLETLQGTTNTSLTALQGLVDGLEGLLGAVATEATLAALSAKLPTLGQKAQSESVSIVPATGVDPATSAKQDEATALLSQLVPSAAPFAITPHASNPLERETDAIAIKTAGTLVFRYPGAGSDTTLDLPVGFFPIKATHVRATSTAAGISGF